MKTAKINFLIGICTFLLVINLIPVSYSQSALYQGYFWIKETGNQLSDIKMTGDLNSDHVQLSEIVVSGRGNVTLLDGFAGAILSNYSLPFPFNYTVLAVGNLDSDVSNEIVAGSLDGNLTTALKYNRSIGSLTLLWEENYNVTQIEIADVTGDSLNEVIIGDILGNLTVLDQNGTFLWSFNLTESVENFKCLDFNQNGTIDAILVLTDNLVTLLNVTGIEEWNSTLSSKPLNAIVGDVSGTEDLEIIVKGQEKTYIFAQDGTSLWNSSSYLSESPAILLYDYSGDSKSEILISGINGSYFINETGAKIKKYLSNSSVSALGISTIFGGSTDYLVMGDFNNNITLWTVDGEYYYNITLTAAVIGIILIDMNADGILDIVTASSNGTVYVIGVPWLIDFTWVFVGIGIGCGVIIASIYIVIKKKTPQTQPPRSNRLD